MTAVHRASFFAMTPPTRYGDPRSAQAGSSGRGAAGLALLLALSSCGPARHGASAPPSLPSGVRAEVVERSYPVRGTTHREIGRSLAENRVSIAGRSFAGVHSWRLSWRYRYGSAASACRIRSLDIRLVSETVLPRWEDRGRADSAIVADWDHYLGLLRAHEN
ncbi:MAG: DUF922 domain-containing protein, partial [Gemmatimonadetes bacterium]|nr:DUF922 domain-containing Zn-dependent protease [Gemmatimonadota bacterium]NIQ53447.1 DUF922 domain-containing Zn-dependent protease [Gemmatimonadota bacterium]NIX43776.1 DUF922 domain-containing protein [Gemmatimonadota bacterium]